MMQSLLQTAAATTPPCSTPLALLRAAGPALGRHAPATRSIAASLSARSGSLPGKCALTSARCYSGGRYKVRPSPAQAFPAKLSETSAYPSHSGSRTSEQYLHSWQRPLFSGTSHRALDISTVLAPTALRKRSTIKPSSTTASTPQLQQHRVYSTSEVANMYTASFAFFEAIWEAGVTHCFVNLGSDHPSIIEAMVKGQREKKGQFPRIITCPNEVCRIFNVFYRVRG